MPILKKDPTYKIFLVICYSATLVLTIGTVRGESTLSKYFELTKSRDLLYETISSLEKEIEHLELEKKHITTSSDYALKVLKDQYHLTEDNEKIIFFAD